MAREDGNPVEGIHGNGDPLDRGHLLVAQDQPGRSHRRNAFFRIRQVGSRFGNGQRGAFFLGEQPAAFIPRTQQGNALQGFAGFQRLARMKVQAISAAIDLRYPQIFQFCGAVADPGCAVGLGDIFGESANRIS